MKIEDLKLNSKENTLPLNIKNSEKIAEGGESLTWKVNIQNNEEIEKLIVLKQVRKEKFADEKEMHESQEFYNFLKSFPGFEKFVPDTLYFKAKETHDSNPQAFCLQKFIKGERIDRIKDDELYRDPGVVYQLLEFVNVAIKMLQMVYENKMPRPDFMRTPELSNLKVMLGGLTVNPRYSSNIFLADKPDKNGQQVFFVDTNTNADIRTKKRWQIYAHFVIDPLEKLGLKKWKDKLENILKNK